MAIGISVIFLGLIFIAIGVSNMMGNISSLHSYHRNKVAPEDVKPLGRCVGIGMIVCAVGCITFGTLDIIANRTANGALTLIGTAVMMVMIIIGCVISIASIIKYNKGLF